MKNIYFSVLILLFSNFCFSQNIHLIAGGGISLGDNGPAYSAKFISPRKICFDDSSNIYIADRDHARIRKINAHNGIITTIAGDGTFNYNGDGIPATTAQLNRPCGVAVDDTGNVYIADAANNRIRKVLAATGNIITIAGNGTPGYNGDNIAATAANLFYPNSLALDDSNNIYLSDANNYLIRKINAYTGLITNVAGNGNQGYYGEGIPAINAQFSWVSGICLDTSKNIFIADMTAHRVRKIDAATGLISTIAGTGLQGYNGDGILATTATLDSLSNISIDDTGNVYISDAFNYTIRKINGNTGIINSMFTPGGQNGIEQVYDAVPDKFGNVYFIYADWLKVLCGLDTATVNIIANPGTHITPGQQVVFTAIINNGGYHPTYQWKKNSTSITGETNNTYTTNTLVNSDTITCAITSNMPCIDSTHLYSSNPLVIQIGSGVNNIESDAFSIYPNPNSGDFTIKLKDVTGGNIAIYDATGRLVWKEEIPDGNNEMKVSKTFSAGIYEVVVTNNYGNKNVNKLVIH